MNYVKDAPLQQRIDPNFSSPFLTPASASAALGDELKVRERILSFELVQESASGVEYQRRGRENGGDNRMEHQDTMLRSTGKIGRGRNQSARIGQGEGQYHQISHLLS